MLLNISPAIIKTNRVLAEEETSVETSDEAVVSGDWTFRLCGDGVELVAYSGSKTDVYVPSTLTADDVEYSVIKLGDGLFADNDTLNSVTLGEGILEIGESAFEGCDNIVCAVTPESLTTIGAKAFKDCTVFNSIILYDGISSIGKSSFDGCANLTVYCNEDTVRYSYVTQNDINYGILNPEATPETVVIDGIEYFVSNGAVTVMSCDTEKEGEVIIPAVVSGKPVTNVNSNAFYNCNLITSIVLPDSIEHFGNYAFSGCSELAEINMPKNLETVGTFAFDNCKKLTEIAFYDNLTSLGQWAFYSFSALKKVTLPDGLTS